MQALLIVSISIITGLLVFFIMDKPTKIVFPTTQEERIWAYRQPRLTWKQLLIRSGIMLLILVAYILLIWLILVR